MMQGAFGGRTEFDLSAITSAAFQAECFDGFQRCRGRSEVLIGGCEAWGVFGGFNSFWFLCWRLLDEFSWSHSDIFLGEGLLVCLWSCRRSSLRWLCTKPIFKQWAAIEATLANFAWETPTAINAFGSNGFEWRELRMFSCGLGRVGLFLNQVGSPLVIGFVGKSW
jgi:hypothetical protein